MGNKQNKKPKFDAWDLQRLSQMTNIPEQQLSQLHQQFQKAAGRDGALTKSEFHSLAGKVGLNVGNSRETEQAFRAFDRDGSGKLSFEEFLSALVMSNPNANGRDRIYCVVDCNNPNGSNGYVTAEYGREVIDSMNQYYGVSADPDEVWNSFGASGASVSQDEFVEYISQSPTYSQYL